MAAITSSPQPRAGSDRPQAQLYPRTWRALLRAGLIACDLVAINGAFIGVYISNLEAMRNAGLLLPSDPLVAMRFLLLFNLAAMLVFTFNGLYEMRRGASRVDEAFKVLTSISLTTVVALLINTLLPELGAVDLPWSRDVLAWSWLIALFACVTLRVLHRWGVVWLRRYGIDTRRVLLVGAREPGLLVWNTIRRRPDLGYRVQGFISDSAPVGTIIEDLPVLGRTAQLGRVVRATQADEVIIALSGRSTQDLMEIISLAEDESVEIKVYPDTFQLITNNEVSIGDLSDLPLVSVKNAALDIPWNRALKRAMDVVVSSMLLLVAAPLMLLIALAIRLDSKGPVFFLQERMGMDVQPFWMLKFRTMRVDAEALGTWTTPNDPRVTRVGRVLRSSSLDELPQLINVLIGQMSLVGPRPEQPRWIEQFSQQIPRYMRRHKEKAGLTGWAQVNGLRGDTSIEDRTRYDLYYIENWSLLLDIKIILRTIANFLTGKQENAY
ncbi:undecaprenyl-phosphate glucose phosphotransferase [Candidatus Oscillochloris fontis]|uniref:undecaprenyl-phosphate glucose phosphotransferase n=1 Tax=Candidatus Oscillochloris fontis TaxID=2496868 RepID=UPI001EE8F0CB|nr:undecaprenyl-phosphate glucose phosphotransferase [Candidatus Oscillochloris fontis]